MKNFNLKSNQKELYYKQMFKHVNDEIICWKGVESKFVTKPKKSFKEYKVTARNWFNRNKAKIFGNHVFYPYIFLHLLQV